MKIMCDTNIILDVLLERQPFVEDSYKVLSLCEEHRSTELAYQAVGKILEIVKVCSVTNSDVLTAYQRKAKDFEDCLVATCAKSIRCDAIVTRNKKDFEEFDICRLTPSELLQQIS